MTDKKKETRITQDVKIIKEGIKKGGRNLKPSTPRPAEPPKAEAPKKPDKPEQSTKRQDKKED